MGLAAGTGYGVVAAAAGYEVAANARSGTTPEVQPTLGSRAPGDNGVFDAVETPKRGSLHRKLLQQQQRNAGPARPAAAAPAPVQGRLALLGRPWGGRAASELWCGPRVLLKWLWLPGSGSD